MRPGSLIAFAGFVLLIASTWSPLLRPLHLFSMNVFQLNKPYGFVLLIVGVTGAVLSLLNQVKPARYAAALSLSLVTLLLVAALLKVNTAFSFIPFPPLAGWLTKQIAFRWGWYLMFAASLTAFAGLMSIKKQFIRS